MGDTLSTPNKEKETESIEDERFRVVTCSMQGWRRGMEDAHTAKLVLENNRRDSFFGVYDGHCGPAVAKFCGRRLHEIIAETEFYRAGRYAQAFEAGFLAADREILVTPELKDTRAGTTAVTVLVTSDLSTLYCGNAGDSRAVLCRKNKAVPLSIDHKPTLDGERARIEAAGGFVMLGRVNGNLALSRAIGDFEFKTEGLEPQFQAVTAVPEVKEFKLTPDDKFFVIACDGIWDVKSNQDVVDFFLMEREKNTPPEEICQKLLDACIATEPGGVGCDNMTLVYVEIKQNNRN